MTRSNDLSLEPLVLDHDLPILGPTKGLSYAFVTRHKYLELLCFYLSTIGPWQGRS